MRAFQCSSAIPLPQITIWPPSPTFMQISITTHTMQSAFTPACPPRCQVDRSLQGGQWSVANSRHQQATSHAHQQKAQDLTPAALQTPPPPPAHLAYSWNSPSQRSSWVAEHRVTKLPALAPRNSASCTKPAGRGGAGGWAGRGLFTAWGAGSARPGAWCMQHQQEGAACKHRRGRAPMQRA